MKTIGKLSLTVTFALSLLFIGCKKDDSDGSNEPAKVMMRLTDAPADYDAVLIDVRAVEIHYEDESEEAGWETLDNVRPGIYNLLDFTNGIDTLIAYDDVPARRINQIRLILGSDNDVVIDGISYDLKTPSAQQSGLKLNVQETLEPGLVYEFWLDFDASRSIVTTGNGNYILKPVIRVFTKVTTGSIEGTVMPAASHPAILAYNAAGDTAAARADSVTGYFLIPGLNDGSYTIEFDPVSPYQPKTETGVVVSTGVVTDMDTVIITQ
ncbi:MAG TPA: carbohydrate-binding protein [Cryomorphaceae bacterium]|nr:carbohydrate-binding protein [Owenweeksia sp.]MBF97383.1 carbohydrate-binding protein [Owenweeksia sp.]HAD95846.1 carbohydrate-binding protein [Cryomorphaceae bacterium]HBF18563.1 carbohydrate-binding protein [Cryomorphaceae bacterium]|tara:strand:- start:8440 stop:9240 length:801 start_codon:yes stop_codon:yes gene_type:complete